MYIATYAPLGRPPQPRKRRVRGTYLIFMTSTQDYQFYPIYSDTVSIKHAMVNFSDLSNELVLMIWDLVELEDVYSFSTISKNVYLLTHDLLREHSRLRESSFRTHDSPLLTLFWGPKTSPASGETSSGPGNHPQR